MKFFWFFLIYSFIGFVLEVIFARLVRNPKRDRKCLYFLPLCPVYGLGAVLILLLPAQVRGNPWLLFLCAALLATAAEYAMDFFYEKVAGVSFWDYSDLPLNLGGRVCLLFTVFWGVLALGLTYGVQPAVEVFTAAIPGWLFTPVLLFFLLDVGITLYVLRREGTTESLRWYLRFVPQRGGRHDTAL